MKHLVECLESESLTRTVIQSVLDPSQLFFGHGFHATFFGLGQKIGQRILFDGQSEERRHVKAIQ